MSESGKYIFHAIAVAFCVLVVVIAAGITIGAAIRMDWLWLVAGLIGTVLAVIYLRHTLRNRPGIV